MSTSSVHHALRSDHRVVLIEAPAGAGKTHQAVAATLDLGQSLPSGTEVLMLAHTNAAVQEFRSRAAGTGARARAMTLTSFTIELLSPYAAALGLPTPFTSDGPEAVPFRRLAPCFLDSCDAHPLSQHRSRLITQ
ncbi:MAG: DEAD/DEAH box helicase family protein [bacterium]